MTHTGSTGPGTAPVPAQNPAPAQSPAQNPAPDPGAARSRWRRLRAADARLRRLYRRTDHRGHIALLIYGLALGCVGVFDVYRGLNLTVRTDGAVLVAAAAVIVGGSGVALRPKEPPSPAHRWAPPAAYLAVLLAAGWIIFHVQSNFVLQPALVGTTAVVACASAVALLLLYGRLREGPPAPAAAPERRVEVTAGATLSAGRLTALATVLGASLALPQFWYASHYEPANAPTVVAVENSIEDVEVRGAHVEFTVNITLKNTGRTPVRVLTSLYEITGTDVTVRPRPVPPDRLPVGDLMGGNYGAAARLSTYATYGEPQLIQVGPIGEDHAWIGPDEEYATTLRGHAPAGRFGLLRVTTDVAVARADRVEVADGPRSTHRRVKDCGGVRMAEIRRPIAHPGTFDWLTESDRELVTYWVFSGEGHSDASPWWPPFPWTSVSIQHTGHGCGHALQPDHDGLEERAMVGWAGSVAEAPVPAPPR
ncbi:hypothetical protein [Streptomyces ficellus]|uniref:Uncharacterized protein n=1 Tax=Streptomyces ficellus TaxID=1977088 RepID=A0A6I6F2S1_9ACTN|nr:hypothetical protein [Streptomyces ficellus]QGV77081.1 hypothetical protein EIZ62_01540 [Streptomyces ficellus]